MQTRSYKPQFLQLSSFYLVGSADNYNGWHPTPGPWCVLTLHLTARKDGQQLNNDMKTDDIEFLTEIVEDIKETYGAFNVSSVRKHLKKYTWFLEISDALSIKEQNEVIAKTI